MSTETTVFTVRTSPEIKAEIEKIIEEIMEEQDVGNKGQAIGVLADAFREYRTKEITPEFKDQLNTIKKLLSSVYSNVLTITDISSAALQDKEDIYKEKIYTLESRIDELELKNGALENKAERYENQIKELKNQLEKADAELKEKKQLESILTRLESLENKMA